jgi:hypothetical protein
MIALEIAAGLALGYAITSFLESWLHECVSDAGAEVVRKWEARPRLYRVLLRTRFSHHVVHHFLTFRKDHVTQFDCEATRAKIEALLLARGRHGRVIIGGDYGNRLHAEGALVFAFPALASGFLLSLLAPWPLAVSAALTLSLSPVFSYFVHPYLHMPFADGQARAPRLIALFLRTPYARTMYRNHFLHHRYNGTSNFNLVLGADVLRGRSRKPDARDRDAMRAVGMPLRG